MNALTLTKHGQGRFWAVADPSGELACACVYNRGATKVARHSSLATPPGAAWLREELPGIG